jgi:hypothetical protein
LISGGERFTAAGHEPFERLKRPLNLRDHDRADDPNWPLTRSLDGKHRGGAMKWQLLGDLLEATAD